MHLARWEPSPGSQMDQNHPPDHPGITIFDHTGIVFLYDLSSMINSSVINNNSSVIISVAVWSQIIIPVWSEKYFQQYN